MIRPLTLGFSPCPNDTFIFHALLHGGVEAAALRFAPRIEDVETLNRLALRGELDISKVSYGVLPYIQREYALLRSGGALGRGCGPLLIARREMGLEELRFARIGVPGRLTTANLLLQLFDSRIPSGIEYPYHAIMPAVASGEIDAGVIIHESRFTYPEHGLTRVVDLGEWWEEVTGAPIPLGAIVARRSLGQVLTHEIDRAIRMSLEAANRDPTASSDFVALHAAEMDPEVAARHIELYVNRYSLDLGREGEVAVEELMRRAEAAGLVRDDRRLPTPG